MGIKLHSADDGLVENNEINVTPFIDVMLVLLIIFMITAPLTTVDIPVKLPVANANQSEAPDKPTYVTLEEGGGVAVGNVRMDLAAVPAAVARATNNDRQRQLFLRGDRHVDYEHLMGLLNVLRDAGYLKVALVGVQSGGSHATDAGNGAQ